MQHPHHGNGKSTSQQAPLLTETVSPGRIIVSAGETTASCVTEARHRLEAAGHTVTELDTRETDRAAVERLVAIDTASAVLDVTLTGLPNVLLGGAPGPGLILLELAGKAGVPIVVAPGGLDSVEFGAQNTIPPQFGKRLFQQMSPVRTLMRTDVNESARLGRLLAEKINEATGPVAVCLPLRGLSSLDAPGSPFYRSEVNMALFGNLTTLLRRDIRLYDCNVNINDPAFAQLCFETITVLLKAGN